MPVATAGSYSYSCPQGWAAAAPHTGHLLRVAPSPCSQSMPVVQGALVWFGWCQHVDTEPTTCNATPPRHFSISTAIHTQRHTSNLLKHEEGIPALPQTPGHTPSGPASMLPNPKWVGLGDLFIQKTRVWRALPEPSVHVQPCSSSMPTCLRGVHLRALWSAGRARRLCLPPPLLLVSFMLAFLRVAACQHISLHAIRSVYTEDGFSPAMLRVGDCKERQPAPGGQLHYATLPGTA